LQSKFKKERIDEIVFTANNQVKAQFSDFDLDFEIKENLVLENTLEVLGVKSLLIIALQNILKNAYLYSSDKKATVVIEQLSPHSLRVCISNQGQMINELEQKHLFEPFFRGSNAAYVQGSGLGLRITKRILDYHQATIFYTAETPNVNQFNVVFSS
jgi:two-component system, OmpR family, sensor histidine kinase ArlS